MSTSAHATNPVLIDGFLGPRGHVELREHPAGGVELAAVGGGPVVVDEHLTRRVLDVLATHVPVGPR